MIIKSSQYQYVIFSTLFFVSIILAAIAVAPLQGVAFTLPKVLLYSFAATVGTLWLILRDDLKACDVLRTHWFGRFFLLFIIVSVLSLGWSVMPVVSLLGSAPRFSGLLFTMVCMALAVCTMNLSQHPRGLRTTVQALIIANALVVTYGLLQLGGADPFDMYWDKEAFLGRIFSSVGQPNSLGAYLVLTLPFVLFRALENAPNRRRYGVLFACNIVVLLGTASRAALAGLLVSGIAFVNLAPTLIQSQISAMAKPHKVIAAAMLLVLIFFGGASFAKRFSLITEQGRSWGTRQIVWFDAIDMIRDRPVGYGFESMGTVYPRYMSPQLHYTESLTATVDRAHNMPIDLLLTVGPLGLLCFYAFLMSLLFAAYKFRRQRAGIFAGALGLLGYSVTMMVGFETIMTQATFWMIAGLVMGLIWQADTRHSSARSLWPVRALACVMCCVSVMSSVVYLQWTAQRVEMDKANRAFYSGQLTYALQRYYNASKLFTLDRVLLARFAETALISLEYASTDEARDVLHAASKQSLDLFDDMTQGQDGTVALFRSWEAALRGAADEVDSQIILAKSLMPNTVDTYRIAARSYSILGDKSAAQDAHAELIELLPPYWKDQSSEAGRILWKENPWMEELQTDRMIRSEQQWEIDE